MSIEGALKWLSEHATFVSAVASAVSAITAVIVMTATIAATNLNRRLARENRALRKAEGDPQVVAYATINPRVWAALDFVIANIGKGPARNVSYKIVSGGEDITSKDVRLLPADVKFSFLPAGDLLSSTMGMGWDLLGNEPLRPFEVEVSYENLAGNKHSARFPIEIAQFDGMGRFGAPYEEQMADSLKKIAGVMEGWSMRRLQVETMSTTERKQENEQTLKIIAEREARRGERPPASNSE